MSVDARLRGLLCDFGGVLTTNVFDSFAQFCAGEGLEPGTVRDRFRRDPEARALLAELECGNLSEEDFEAAFAPFLGVEPAGLIDRLFAGMQPDERMVSAVRSARAGGIRTGLISNSWGHGRYDRSVLPELFDAVVISGEEGIRKPAPEIYALGAERLGLPPRECVFVDDLAFNLDPARELGMATVHHVAADRTIAELERLLGIELT